MTREKLERSRENKVELNYLGPRITTHSSLNYYFYIFLKVYLFFTYRTKIGELRAYQEVLTWIITISLAYFFFLNHHHVL